MRDRPTLLFGQLKAVLLMIENTRMRAVKRRLGGFTAIELMITLTIVATFATVAFPSFVTMVRSTQLSTTGDLLNADLLIARREAIKQNGRILVCAAASPSTMTCGTNWANGWIVCYDIPYNGVCDTTVPLDPNPIVRRGAVNSSMTIGGPAAAVQFNANGTQGSDGSNRCFTVSGSWTGSASYIYKIAGSGHISKASSCS
jgi:prepilin-type N-terminal cleavage/methylation domain-containing protein